MHGVSRADGEAVSVASRPKRKRQPPASHAERVLRRDLVWLKLYESGLTQAAIADMTGFSRVTVLYGLRRARSYLRKHEDSHT